MEAGLKFNNIISNFIYFDFLNDHLLDDLLENKILIKYKKHGDDFEDDYFFVNQNDKRGIPSLQVELFLNDSSNPEFDNPKYLFLIQYKGKIYKLNNEIINEIPKLFKRRIKLYSSYHNDDLDRIKSRLESMPTKKDKMSYISTEYIKYYEENIESSVFYNTYYSHGSDSKKWNRLIFDFIFHSTKNQFGIISYYLHYDWLDFFNYCSKIEGKVNIEVSSLIRDWVKFENNESIKVFIENKINQLEISKADEDFDKTAKNKSRLTPIEQVCYIDQLRNSSIPFSQLDKTEKLRHLNNITGNQNYNEELQLNYLEKLIDLNVIEFEKMKAAEYARRLNKISMSSVSNIRKKIRLFNLEAIRQENVKTDKDIQHNKEFQDAKVKIDEAFKQISSFF
jgi:hypothetical protein